MAGSLSVRAWLLRRVYSVERIRVYGRAPIYRNLIQWMVEGLV